jgi:serine/threonine protein kinase
MSQDPLLGRTLLGQYTIEKRLGAGGFSTIYVADQPSLGRKVAIKTIHPHLATNADTVTRFHREGLAISRLKHPAIVEIFNLGQEDDGLVWIAMEYLEGESLASRLHKQGKMTAQQLADMLKPVCEVLSEAHEQGIIHRDLKPENIMLMAYRGGFLPKVLDFGMASLQEGSSQSSAMVGGTFAYMPPEQWQGLKYTDARSDIYALGVIAYQCLANRFPISADEGAFLAWAQKHLNEPPSPLVEAPPQVAEVIYKALQKEQANRQQDIMQFWSELSQAAQFATQAAPASATAQLGPPPQLQQPQQPVSATMHLGAPPQLKPQAPVSATAYVGPPPQIQPPAPVAATAQLGAPPQLKPQAKPFTSPIPSAPEPAAPSNFPTAPGSTPQAPGAQKAQSFDIPKSSFDIPKSSFDAPRAPVAPPPPAQAPIPQAPRVQAPAPIPPTPKVQSPIPQAPIPPAPKAPAPAPAAPSKGAAAAMKSQAPAPQAPKPAAPTPRPQAQETKGGILQRPSNKPNPAASDLVDPDSLRNTLSSIVSKKKSIADEVDDEDEESDEDWEPCFSYGFIAPDGTLQMAYYESESPFDLEFEDQEIKVQTDFAPSLTFDSYGDLYCAITAKNGKIYAGTFDDDGYLQLQHIGGDARSNAAPSLICWNGDLCIAIKGTDDHVYLGYAEDIEDIEFNLVDENATTIASPGLAYCEDTLYIAVTGPDNLVYIAYGEDPEEFSFQWTSDQFQTKQAPSIAYVEDQLFFGLVGNDNKPYLAVMDDEDAIEPWEVGDGYKTKLTPSLSVWGDTIFYAMTSTTNKVCLALASSKERRPGKQLRFYEVGDGATSKIAPGGANEPPPDYYSDEE